MASVSNLTIPELSTPSLKTEDGKAGVYKDLGMLEIFLSSCNSRDSQVFGILVC